MFFNVPSQVSRSFSNVLSKQVEYSFRTSLIGDIFPLSSRLRWLPSTCKWGLHQHDLLFIPLLLRFQNNYLKKKWFFSLTNKIIQLKLYKVSFFFPECYFEVFSNNLIGRACSLLYKITMLDCCILWIYCFF